MITIDDVIAKLKSPAIAQLSAPIYINRDLNDVRHKVTYSRIGCAVESMKQHTTSEGWEIFEGLQHAGYKLVGCGLPVNENNLYNIIRDTVPGTLLLQDKREWDYKAGDFRDPKAQFHNVSELKKHNDIFKGTILKDSQQRPEYHRQSAEEIGAHFWVVYYHPRIVHYLAPYTRPQHLIRTYHSVNVNHIPALNWRPQTRAYALLSGAMGGAYPLRTRMRDNIRSMCDLPKGNTVNYLPHPGYHRKGTATPSFLKTLAGYKVAICTSSMYSYTLRKIIEATACGCIVLTDLASDEVLPCIDGNLIRVHPNITPKEVGRIIKNAVEKWDSEKQKLYSDIAKEHYSHIAVGKRLAEDIESLRLRYND